MIGKLSVLGFSLVTALSSSALAGEPCHPPRGPATYGGYGPPPPVATGYGGHGYGYGGDRGGPRAGALDHSEVDLRYADLNRDGWVALQEALDSGRQVFRSRDRNGDRVLTRHELGRRGVKRGDRNDDRRVTLGEHQRAVRAEFAALDTNRDGFLARYELSRAPAPGNRSAGWWSTR